MSQPLITSSITAAIIVLGASDIAGSWYGAYELLSNPQTRDIVMWTCIGLLAIMTGIPAAGTMVTPAIAARDGVKSLYHAVASVRSAA